MPWSCCKVLVWDGTPMTKRRCLFALLFVLAGCFLVLTLPSTRWRLSAWLQGESVYQGRPTSYWAAETRRWQLTLFSDKYPMPFWDRPLTGWENWLERAGLVTGLKIHPLIAGDAAAAPVLLELLQEEDEHVRLLSLHGLFAIIFEQPGDDFIFSSPFTPVEMTQDRLGPPLDQRKAAVARAAFPAVLAVYRGDSDALVRKFAAETLFHMDPAAARANAVRWPGRDSPLRLVSSIR
jgi:hypothetical protein